MKILVTGSNGMLAQAVRKRFKDEELILTDVDELDITKFKEVKEFVSKVKPDVIINCAAYTAVDKAEDDLFLAMRINSVGPENLAIAADENNAVLVHISTDYVFGGDLPVYSGPYLEDDEKRPETVYGITKLEGERTIEEITTKYYIFRTAWLYGDGKNFVRTMLKLGKEKDEVSIVNDQHGSPTYTVDLADVIYQALKKKIPYGTYHATNLGYTTWYDFTKEIFNQAGISCKVNPVISEQFKTAAKRPKNSMISKDKILKAGIEIPDWQDALTRYLKEELKK